MILKGAVVIALHEREMKASTVDEGNESVDESGCDKLRLRSNMYFMYSLAII